MSVLSFLSAALLTWTLYADGITLSDMPVEEGNDEAAYFRPHYQCRHGSGQYPGEGYNLTFADDAAGNFAIMLVGRADSGKSRIIERVLKARPTSISSANVADDWERFTDHGTVYPKTFGDVKLFAADTVGFLSQPHAGLQDVFQSILDNIDYIVRERIPLKRIYFIVESRSKCLSVSANLQFLKVALGSEAASEIRFVVNKCDVAHSRDPHAFQCLAENLGNKYQEVFSTPLPPDRVLYISAEDCMGQLYDDLVDAYHGPSLELATQAPLPEASDDLEPNAADRLALNPQHRPQLIGDVNQFIFELENRSGERETEQAATRTNDAQPEPPRPATGQPNDTEPQPPVANQQEENQIPPPSTHQPSNDETAPHSAGPVQHAVQDPSPNLPPRPEQDPANPYPDSQSTQSNSIPPTSDLNSNTSAPIHAVERDRNQQPAVAHAVQSNAAPEPDAAVQIEQDPHSNPQAQNTKHSIQYSDSSKPKGIRTFWIVMSIFFCTLLLVVIATYFLKNRSIRVCSGSNRC